MSDIYRLRAKIRYTKSSGLATWSRDQMAVRYDQAKHVNEGYKNEEPKFNRVIDEDATYNIFECDLPLLDKAHAQDAFDTLGAASVFGQRESGWIEHHKCGHEKVPNQPCVTIDFAGENLIMDEV